MHKHHWRLNEENFEWVCTCGERITLYDMQHDLEKAEDRIAKLETAGKQMADALAADITLEELAGLDTDQKRAALEAWQNV